MHQPKKKIFVLSLHRTATKSTNSLLCELGFSSMHNFSTLHGIDYRDKVAGFELNHPYIVEAFLPVINQIDSFADIPFPVLYKTLHSYYPDAYFIAIYRSFFDWVKSVRKHVGTRELSVFEKIQYWHYLPELPTHIDDVSDERLIGMHIFHYGQMRAYFESHSAAKFSLFHLTDPLLGQKITDFLGVQKTGVIFPNINT